MFGKGVIFKRAVNLKINFFIQNERCIFGSCKKAGFIASCLRVSKDIHISNRIIFITMAKEQNNSNAGVFYNALTHGTKITGKIEAEGDFRIDGEIDGEIICNGKVLVGQHALLKGTITCANAEISGSVNGTLVISEILSLQATALIEGDIKTKTLVIQPGAVFNGTCSMSPKVMEYHEK